MSQVQAQVSIEYKGGVYLSQPYKNNIVIPLLAAAGGYWALDLFALMSEANPEITTIIRSAPARQYDTMTAAETALVDILRRLFPLLPALEYIEDLDVLLAGLTAICEALNKAKTTAPTPLTVGGELAKAPISEQAEPAAVTPAPDTIDYRPAQAMAEYLGGYAPIATDPDPVAIADPSGLTSAVTPLPIDDRYAEMSGFFEPV